MNFQKQQINKFSSSSRNKFQFLLQNNSNFYFYLFIFIDFHLKFKYKAVQCQNQRARKNSFCMCLHTFFWPSHYCISYIFNLISLSLHPNFLTPHYYYYHYYHYCCFICVFFCLLPGHRIVRKLILWQLTQCTNNKILCLTLHLQTPSYECVYIFFPAFVTKLIMSCREFHHWHNV